MAAGGSRRFGAQDKLLAPLRGRPLVTYAAAALSKATPERLIVITQSSRIKALLPGFELVEPEEASPKQADSLRAGVARAQQQGVSQIVVVLADMPFVSPELIAAVVARGVGRDAASATDGIRPMPPAWFSARLFPELLSITGDRGAASLLRELPATALVRAPRTLLTDIDTTAALAQAEQDAGSLN